MKPDRGHPGERVASGLILFTESADGTWLGQRNLAKRIQHSAGSNILLDNELAATSDLLISAP
jgi:hypothetical protein